MTQEAATIEFGGGSLADTLAVAKVNGISYESTVQRAIDHDEEALSLLFRFAALKDGGLDGAASEGHATVLGLLLRRFGDDAFSRSIVREDTQARTAVEAALLYDAGIEDVKTDRHQFRDAWPMTAAALAAGS